MSGIATAIVGSAVIGGISGSSAARSAERAAETSAEAQMQQLEYLKEREKIPQEIRERSLQRLENAYTSQLGEAERIQLAKESPLYKEIMGLGTLGEEAILRNAAATGGLRSGNVQGALADYNQRLGLEALTSSLGRMEAGRAQNIEVLRGLGNIPSNTAQIASTIGNIGATRAAGIQASGQIGQQTTQNILNTAMTGLGLGMQYGGWGQTPGPTTPPPLDTAII